MTDTMRCLFCKEELTDPVRTPDWEYEKIFIDFVCDNCHMEYTLLDDTKELVEYILKAKDYRMVINLVSKSCEIRKVDQIGRSSFVMQLNSIPQNINPQNVGEKIKTFLLFS